MDNEAVNHALRSVRYSIEEALVKCKSKDEIKKVKEYIAESIVSGMRATVNKEVCADIDYFMNNGYVNNFHNFLKQDDKRFRIIPKIKDDEKLKYYVNITDGSGISADIYSSSSKELAVRAVDDYISAFDEIKSIARFLKASITKISHVPFKFATRGDNKIDVNAELSYGNFTIVVMRDLDTWKTIYYRFNGEQYKYCCSFATKSVAKPCLMPPKLIKSIPEQCHAFKELYLEMAQHEGYLHLDRYNPDVAKFYGVYEIAKKSAYDDYNVVSVEFLDGKIDKYKIVVHAGNAIDSDNQVEWPVTPQIQWIVENLVNG